jgi:SAM-dependent methyltransferase
MDSDDAKAKWNERYQVGELACTQEQVIGDPIDYTQHPFLWKHSVAERLTGSPDLNPADLIAARFLSPPAKRGLAIGSGMAFFEEWLVKAGHVETIDAFEYSEAAVAGAKRRLADLGLADKVRMFSGDVTKASIQPASYDLIVVQAAIHHFFEIDEMFQFMHSTLKPGGLLIYDEYVGPDHMQYEPKVIELLNLIDNCLAEKYRFDHQRGAIRTQPPYATMAQMLDMDPSEGVHASRILPLTYQYFDVLHRGDYGGTFMRPFFTGILPNFDFTTPADQTIAKLIILIEALMMEQSTVPSHHTRVVAKRRETPRGPFSEAEGEKMGYRSFLGTL